MTEKRRGTESGNKWKEQLREMDPCNAEIDSDDELSLDECSDEEFEKLLENDISIPELDDVETENVEIDDKLLEGGWVYQSFSPAGSAFHGALKGKNYSVKEIKMEYNTADQLLLEKWKVDASNAVRKARKTLGRDCPSALTPIMAFAAALPMGFMKLLAEWLHEAHARNGGRAEDQHRVTFEELVTYFKVEVVMRYHSFSAKDLKEHWADAQLTLSEVNFHTKVRKHLREADIPFSKQPGPKRSHNKPFSVDPVIQKLQAICTKHWATLFFVPGTTWVDLNDDKLPHGSELWEIFGMKLIPTGSKRKKPVVHVIGSVGSGFLISTDIELVHSSLSKSIEGLIQRLVQTYNQDVASSLVFFIDRGYLALAKEQDPDRRINIVEILLGEGVRFFGTAKNTFSFPFREEISQDDENKAVVHGERVTVPMRGTTAVFSATNRTTNVTAMMMRHGMGKQRTARLITNEPSFGPTTWVYETSSGRDANSPGGVKRAPHQPDLDPISPEARAGLGVEARTTRAFQELESRVYAMTIQQRSQDWFLARLFRCTSTNMHASINCTTSVFLDSLELKRLHKAVKKIAQLEPRKPITFRNGIDFVPDEVEEADDEEIDTFEEIEKTNEQLTETSTGGDRKSVGFWLDNCPKDLLIRLVTKDANLPLPQGVKITKPFLAKMLADLERASTGISENWNLSSSSSSPQKISVSQRSQASAVDADDDNDDNDDDEDDRDDRDDGDDRDDEEENDDPQLTFLRVMVKHWFLSPFSSGAKAGGGSLNEDAITPTLKSFISMSTNKEFGILKMKEYGLLVNREVQFAADSPDGVCALSRVGEDGSHHFHTLVALDYKTSTTAEAINKTCERARIAGKWITCTAGTEAMRQAIPNPSYRTQAVHRAAVLGLSHTLLVYATPTGIQQAVLVEIGTEQRKSWLTFLKKLQDKYMQFAYGEEVQSPPRLGKDRKRVYGYAREHHTLDQYLGLWRAHSDDVITHGTPPAATRILAKMASSWNKFMGNIDTARKVMNNRKALYRGMKPSTLLWMTFFDYTLYNAFRLWQCSRLLDSGASFATFNALTNARKKLGSYKTFLRDVKNVMFPESIDKWKPGLAQSINGANPDWSYGESQQPPSSTASNPTTLRPPKKRKALRGAVLNPNADINKLRLCRTVFHELVEFPQKLSCVLCCTYCDKQKEHRRGSSGKPLREPRKRYGYCSVCQVALCKKCWKVFHIAETLPIPQCERDKLDS